MKQAMKLIALFRVFSFSNNAIKQAYFYPVAIEFSHKDFVAVRHDINFLHDRNYNPSSMEEMCRDYPKKVFGHCPPPACDDFYFINTLHKKLAGDTNEGCSYSELEGLFPYSEKIELDTLSRITKAQLDSFYKNHLESPSVDDFISFINEHYKGYELLDHLRNGTITLKHQEEQVYVSNVDFSQFEFGIDPRTINKLHAYWEQYVNKNVRTANSAAKKCPDVLSKLLEFSQTEGEIIPFEL
jgi:hypothetical protein